MGIAVGTASPEIKENSNLDGSVDANELPLPQAHDNQSDDDEEEDDSNRKLPACGGLF